MRARIWQAGKRSQLQRVPVALRVGRVSMSCPRAPPPRHAPLSFLLAVGILGLNSLARPPQPDVSTAHPGRPPPRKCTENSWQVADSEFKFLYDGDEDTLI